MTMGEKKRFVTFNLDHELEREMYELSKTINFAKLVKRALLSEVLKSKAQVGESSITVSLGE